MWQALIFDLDGTLVDSAPDIHAAGNAVLAAEGLPPVPFDRARGFIGNGAPIFVARMEAFSAGENRPDRTARMVQAFVNRYEHGASRTRPFPGADAALAALHAAGLPLGLCTNKPAGPARALPQHFGWSDFFPVLIGGDTLPTAKPDPAPLIASAERLGLPPDRVLFVGDSETDAETAARAGVDFALFTQGYRRTPAAALPHRLAFDDWSALPALLAPPSP
ncbi:MAG: phosphoglycolate phosphatase [Gemmobacter sp.]|uniref:phosphoglycolate phosphatase n=1 Tax=Gemmobacter sp. TaxID=1898957 RepID=UPI00391DA1D2